MKLKDFLRQKLIENGLNVETILNDETFEECKTMTGSKASFRTFERELYRVKSALNEGLEKKKGKLLKEIEDSYSKYDREGLIDILTEAITKNNQKMSIIDIKEMAKDLNIPFGALMYHIPDLANVLKGIYEINMLHISEEVERVGYQEKLNVLKRENNYLKKDEARFAMFMDAVKNVVHQYEPISTPNVIKNVRADSVASLLVSDWHFGEEVGSEDLQGINEYNPEVARIRLDRLFNGTIDYCQTIGLDEIEINMLGDNISGRIHQELLEHTADPTVMTVLQFSDYMSHWIKKIADSGIRIRKVRSMPGNHGRFQDKPSFKKRAYNNHEYYLAMFMKRELENIVDDFLIPPSLFFIDETFDTVISYTHGDCFRGGTGLNPVSGTWGRDVAKLNGLYSKTGLNFDILTMGHFHSGDMKIPSFDGTKIVVNGSGKGTDEFALGALKTGSRPNQTIFTIEKGKKGCTRYLQTIYLDQET